VLLDREPRQLRAAHKPDHCLGGNLLGETDVTVMDRLVERDIPFPSRGRRGRFAARRRGRFSTDRFFTGRQRGEKQ
jgi:hypothetical protein